MVIIKRMLVYIFFAVLCAAVMLPVIMMVLLSLNDETELASAIMPLESGKGFCAPDPLPFFPTFSHYKKLMLYTPEFYRVFFNSLRNTAVILVCQVLFAAPSAWAFSRMKSRHSKLLFDMYVIFMLMPFQVTMLSQYLLLDRLGLMDTSAALILPAVFSTFPVFIMYRSFSQIPEDVLDHARIDGAGEFTIFLRIGLPMGRSGMLAAVTLGFLDLWNMVEQPLAFIKDKRLLPLSVYLPMIDKGSEGIVLAASVITLIPAVFVFIIGQDELEAGMISSGIKE